MDHGLQRMRQFALTKMYVDPTMTSLKTKLIVCGTRKGEMLDKMKCSSSFDTTVATATGL